jgi:peptide/nickel transport system permease protein
MTSVPRAESAARPAIAWLVLLGVVAVAAPWVAPFDPAAQPDIVAMAGRPPSWPHLLGTDGYSRDVLSRLMHGTRVSLGLGVMSGILSAALGTGLGMVAGLAPGWADALMQRTVDVGVAVPRVVVLAAAVAMTGPLAWPTLVLILAATGWFGTARLVRADTRAIQHTEWMQAAVAQGVSPLRLVLHHVWPAVRSTAIVAAILAVSQTIAIESAVSFLGLGVQPPTPSWGTLLADAADRPWTWWWLLVAPGAALVATLLACQSLADHLKGESGWRRETPA